MDKWQHIKEIGNMSDKYGDKLLLLMDRYNKSNLRDISTDEAKEFYEHMVENKPYD